MHLQVSLVWLHALQQVLVHELRRSILRGANNVGRQPRKLRRPALCMHESRSGRCREVQPSWSERRRSIALSSVQLLAIGCPYMSMHARAQQAVTCHGGCPAYLLPLPGPRSATCQSRRPSASARCQRTHCRASGRGAAPAAPGHAVSAHPAIGAHLSLNATCMGVKWAVR
jgi:hypothetical protein